MTENGRVRRVLYPHSLIPKPDHRVSNDALECVAPVASTKRSGTGAIDRRLDAYLRRPRRATSSL